MTHRIFPAALVVCALSVAAAAQQPPGEEPPGAGTLLATMNGMRVRLPVVSMDVSLSIAGPIVRSHLDQRFENPTDEALDADYEFPLPEGAAVDGLVLEIGERRFSGTIEEKEEARRTFDEAKVRGRGAGLVEQHRPNVFLTRVANIPPRGAVVIRLDMQDDAEWSGGEFQTVFPTTITARYAPDGSRTSDPLPGTAAPASDEPRVSIRATIDAGVPIDDVISTSHVIRTSRRGTSLDIRVGPAPVPADRDFVLRWRPKVAAAPLAGGLIEDRPDGRYGLAMVVPPSVDRPEAAGFPTQTVFVIDVSGSMEGPSLAQAKAAMLVALDRLRAGDTFTMIKFDQSSEAYSDKLVAAEPLAIAAAKQWVSSLEVGGGTEILPAVVRALDISGRGDPSMLQRVILITDGAVDNEDEVVAEVGRHLGDVRLHIVGIGTAPNRWLMKELARAGRGSFESIGNRADVQAKTIDLMSRTERAAITDLSLEWDGAPPLSADPDPVPDLYEGRPLVVTARFDPGKPLPKLRVWGRAPGGPVTMDVDFAAAGANAGIGTRWARARVAALQRSRVRGVDPATVRADVIDLAKRFSLVTSYTSFVVVADDEHVSSDGPCDDEDGDLPQSGSDEPLLLLAGVILFGAGALVAMSALRAGRASA